MELEPRIISLPGVDDVLVSCSGCNMERLDPRPRPLAALFTFAMLSLSRDISLEFDDPPPPLPEDEDLLELEDELDDEDLPELEDFFVLGFDVLLREDAIIIIY